MNLPNKLSILRICLIPVMVALMYVRSDVCDLLAAVVFAVGSFTDYLDGHIARSRNLVTTFGKFIDPVADKLLVLSAFIMLVDHELLPAWLVVLVLARELSVDGLRLVAVSRGKVIAAGMLGKIKTVSQMALVLHLMFSRIPAMDRPLSIVMLVWVAAITLGSGIDYFIRNRNVLKEEQA